MKLKILWFFYFSVPFSVGWMDERPVLESIDGNLIISSAKDKNISIHILGNGYFTIDDIDLSSIAVKADHASRLIEQWRNGYLRDLIQRVDRYGRVLEGPHGLERRMSILELGVDPAATNTSSWPSKLPNNAHASAEDVTRVSILSDRVNQIDAKLKKIIKKLRKNQCTSNPCLNGGTCIKVYDGFQCICPSNWEGVNCATDVDECIMYAETDLGCQNGATCRNLPGSYRCSCAAGWYGPQCLSNTAVCNATSTRTLCGEHGRCITSGDRAGYTCFCDQGWKEGTPGQGCDTDVDECSQLTHPPCSVQPPVPCTNTPGGFHCGSCPAGYTGSGHYCADIDECQMNNGGCSIIPQVQCINTMGSRLCGSCPPGYQGDGVTCVFVGSCRINNGGCHPLATCIDRNNVLVECQCPQGYHGSGMGPQGCLPGAMPDFGVCAANPCVHGSCIPDGRSFICRCHAGYTGIHCETLINPCSPNPCQNGGNCTYDATSRAISCECTATYSGPRCETAKQVCGGVIRDPTGTLSYPANGASYQHGLSCAFILTTNVSLVLNVTFTKFDLESTAGCRHDFLQVHDGGNAGSHQLGRFCGRDLPLNGHFISTHNNLYLWFHTDNSVSRSGFSIHWNSIAPVCGGSFDSEHGTISSPGSPGRYSPNRDCTWTVTVRPGKRIQFHFFTVLIESSPNCTTDYLEIRDIIGDRTIQLGLYCNHTHPPPLITSSSEAMVHFHSDERGQDLGFQITYSSVEGTPGCGGVYTADEGTISSPAGSLTSYAPNMYCEWKIQLPQTERIRLTWISFDLEDSHTCRFDYVKLFEEHGMEKKLLGRYCGNNLPPAMVAESNVVMIAFKTDWSNQGEGFQLHYEIACGGEFHEPTGIITSPYYPNLYPGARTCLYEIAQQPGKRIILNMIAMDIEGSSFVQCYFDHLEIFDGDNENSTLLANLCGNTDKLPTSPFLSTLNHMLLKFETDISVSGRGFMANYTTIDGRCGGLFKTASGTITSPDYPNGYNNDEDCTWVIQAPPGHVIQLTWTLFSLEYDGSCVNDYVLVTEKYNEEDNRLLRSCGTKVPPIMTSQSRTLTLQFHTDSTITSDGFSVNYIFVDASKVCGGHYFASIGVMKSPGYPEYYPRDRECVWIIEAPNKYQVKLTVEKFDVEDHSNCMFDYLEIRNGGYDTSPLLGKFCGTSIPTEIQSLTNQLYVKFVSDGSSSSEGFLIRWDSTTYGCGGSLTAASGDVTSPYYPQVYSRSTECTWRIAVAAGSLIQIIFVDLDLEEHSRCRFDYVEISAMVKGRRKNTNRYCGRNHPTALLLDSNVAQIRFRSDYTNSGHGFHIKYVTMCNNKIYGFSGVIESPNFPNQYPENINCTWIINAPKGNTVNLTFSHFSLEAGSEDCPFDYLEVKEGAENVPDTSLGKYCSEQTLPPKIFSTQHQVFVEFITDDYVRNAGFRLEWVINGCGGYLNRPEGQISSPGYPNPYPHNIECEWLIDVDHGHSVEITFLQVNTEKAGQCRYDRIEIFSGDDATAPKLAEFCHSPGPINYTSMTNQMYVKFSSDSSYAGNGFLATYKTVPITCGGTFVADRGYIHSTNYPLNYPNTQNCEWYIEVDKNHVVNLTFLDFDMERSNNCTDDYVRVHDGPSNIDALLGTFCSNEAPPSIVSSGNTMLVVMRSDSILTAKGFRAEFSRDCGARIIVNNTGILASASNLHLRSDDALNCSWILEAADPADHITLTVFHIDLTSATWDETCEHHYLAVYEGAGLDGPSRGKWCSNKSPSPIVSNGNTLTVNLVAQDLSTDLFQASYSVLNSACGGSYYSESGTIASPLYPESYPMNAECVWTLDTAPGNQIKLVFSEFDIESSTNCDADYLEIREESGVGKLIGVYCGNTIDEITLTKKLWIKFRTDNVNTGRGFLAEYNFVHGNSLSGPSGEIASPLYPRPFLRSDYDVTWRITVEFGSIVRIEFDDFHIERVHTECYLGSLTIYDGYESNAPVLADLCGSTVPEPVQSSSNVMLLKLNSNTFREGNWFHLLWHEIPRDTPEEEKDTISSECNEEIVLSESTNTSHYITSPGFPQGYANNLRCKWIFKSSPGTHLVIRFLDINLEETDGCNADYIDVTSGLADKLSRVCLSNSTGTSIEATNILTVQFNTDVYVNRTGFRAVVYTECGGELGGPNGVIEFNNTIRANQRRSWSWNCEWNITARPGKTIQVEIVSIAIDTVENNQCGNYYLMMKNGGPDSPLLGAGKYCGRDPIAPLNTTGNKLYVKAVGTGLHVQYKLIYKEVGLDCGGTIILSKSMAQYQLTTPRYPNIPPPFSECFWTFMAPAGEKILIHFLDRFDLSYSANCEREYVELRDGGTDSANLIGKYCGDRAPSTQSTIGNLLYVHFYTDVPDPKNGFKAVVEAGDSCGGIRRGTRGVITSPNYPDSYSKNLNCIWQIVGPPDHTLKIQFRDLHVSGYRRCENSDYVSIAEKVPSSATNDTGGSQLIGTYCVFDKLNVIQTSTNEAIVTFHTRERSYGNYRGFSLNFTASRDACGGDLTGVSGEFKSIGYPNLNLRSRYCEWHITVPEGHRVLVTILDLDTGASDDSESRYYLAFYNDPASKSKALVIRGTEYQREVGSSSNTMVISYWRSSGHRGINAKYSAVLPAPCGGIIENLEGDLTAPTLPPFNGSSFYCQWTVKAPDSLLASDATLTVQISGLLGRYQRQTRSCVYYPKYIMVADSKEPVGIVCGNVTQEPYIIRSPAPLNIVRVLNGSYGTDMNFNMTYRWNKCGGILTGPSHVISAPTGISYPKSCAWRVEYPDEGEVIRISFNRFNVGSCDKGYVILRNGGSMSPEVGKFCGNMKPQNFTSSSHKLWIEYWAAESPGDFEFRLDLVSDGCGGTMRGSSREISSLGFPHQYPNNAECTWEITTEPGYQVGLSFVDRFNLETSALCVNDFVEVYNWINAAGNGVWQSLGKSCGRNIPPSYNATSNRMTVVFRTNEVIQGDGFRAVWERNCGGVFMASSLRQVIESPNYPNFYSKYLQCNYTIIVPQGKSILIEFNDFNLEGGKLGNGNCKYDNLTVKTTEYHWNYPEETYCNDNRPPVRTFDQNVTILFQTDQNTQRRGFQFEFFLNECGGEVSSSTVIQSPVSRDLGEYFGELNCTWVITAPSDKSIVLRFESFELEYSASCYFDHLMAFDDTWANTDKVLGRLCGNMTVTPPVLKSPGNVLTISFLTDSSRHYRGFSALVLFTKSVAAGCGGKINLTSSQTWKTQKAINYESYEDCMWTVFSSAEKNIKMTITSMDVRLTPNKTIPASTEPCNGDFLEVRDGRGPHAQLISRYCGRTVPPPIVSSMNTLWIRFVSDGEVEGTGVSATFDLIEPPCGNTLITIDNTTKTVTSPGYPGNYPLGIRCKWVITAPRPQILRVHFRDVNMENSSDCQAGDHLQVADTMGRRSISQDFGEDFVYNGRLVARPMSRLRAPGAAYTFCSKFDDFEYYSVSNQIEVDLKTTLSSEGKPRKFKFDVGLADCSRNYTSPQGKIVHQGFTNCWIVITVPAGRTISLYFNEIRLFDVNDCTRSYLKIHDGNFSAPLLATLCGMRTPSPIFSSGNVLSLHSTSERGVTWENYDITYTSTDKGPGCGGDIYNYAGKITSPMYPANYRNASECTWNISVPRGFKIILNFLVFDLGASDCSTDYLLINDQRSAQEIRASRYCAGDNPANFHGLSNAVSITYATSVNNGGSGWVIRFVGVEQSSTGNGDFYPQWSPSLHHIF